MIRVKYHIGYIQYLPLRRFYKMLKKILCLSLCLVMLAGVLVGCAERDEDDKGAYIYMYLTDPVYDFDPAHAYGNESALKVVSLLFDNLFVLDEEGKVQKSLVKDYKYIENEAAREYKLEITLNDTAWSDGIAVSSSDVVYAWKRILDVANTSEAASLLYDIKNARDAKAGECSIDDVYIYSLNETEMEICFENPVNIDEFLYKLTSPALSPLRREIIKTTVVETDWAKKPSVFVCSGPFRLREVSYESESAGLTLERNPYYYRNIEKDAIDKSVTPYRLIVDYTMTDEEILEAYENGQLFYIGDVPLSLRGSLKDQVTLAKKSMSTHTYFLNEKALIRHYSAAEFAKLEKLADFYKEDESEEKKGLIEKSNEYLLGTEGDAIFAIPEVRQALSMVIDRATIAEEIVFAEAATGLIPTGIFNTDRKTSFRAESEALLDTDAAAKADALAILDEVNIDPEDYMFAISVAAYDEVHVKIAEMVQEAWNDLGFHVALYKVEASDNGDFLLSTGEALEGVKDDIFAENLRAGLYEVAALDYVAYTADASSMLAPFAKGYTGGAAAKEFSIEFEIPTHTSGYHNEDYDSKMDEVFEATDANTRAALLHEAEEILMEDMAVIPIIFNYNATLTSKELSNIKYTYYGSPIFTKTSLKNYLDYIPETEE